jgi:hypothetical protein
MPSYNFQPQFEPDIMADRKLHTIRARRKRRPRAGDTCYLFVGLRTKRCRRLKERRCTRVQDICLTLKLRIGYSTVFLISIDGAQPLKVDEANTFARSDGFHGWQDMARFWIRKHKLGKRCKKASEGCREELWRGDLIHWESDAEHKERIIREAVQAFKRDRNRAHLPGRRAGRTPK